MESFDRELYPVRKRLPASGVAGVVLVTFCWILNWDLPGLRTHLLFFPLWLGYCLTVDGLVRWRSGSSLAGRDAGGYIRLFFLSAPVWWLFEGLNFFTENWSYLGRSAFTDWQYFLLSTLCFSTVIPAVFSTAELLETLPVFRDLKLGFRRRLHRSTYWKLHLAGWVMLALMLVWPTVFFPFMWLSLFFILDPINALLGNRSLIVSIAHGYLRPLVAYGLGALICGFFWEMWNYHSFPKWIYDIPYLSQPRIFEMPLAGYGGYIPFGWELYAVYQLVSNLGRKS